MKQHLNISCLVHPLRAKCTDVVLSKTYSILLERECGFMWVFEQVLHPEQSTKRKSSILLVSWVCVKKVTKQIGGYLFSTFCFRTIPTRLPWKEHIERPLPRKSKKDVCASVGCLKGSQNLNIQRMDKIRMDKIR